MTSHPEHEHKRPDDEKAEEAGVLSKSEQLRAKLKMVGHYVLLALAPVLAIIALAVAMIAVSGVHSNQKQLAEMNNKIEGLSTSLSNAKAEADKLKMAMLKEKTQQNEELAKQNGQLNLLIHNITQLQVKLKVSPTLEDQLRQPVAISQATPISAVVESHPVSAVGATPPSTKKVVSAPADKSISPQVRAMKEAIDMYNKKN